MYHHVQQRCFVEIDVKKRTLYFLHHLEETLSRSSPFPFKTYISVDIDIVRFTSSPHP
jgi:hypothetical protein